MASLAILTLKLCVIFSVLFRTKADQSNPASCKCASDIGTIYATAAELTDYRQIPADECWPTAEQWSSFNDTINGTLIAAVPPAVVCYLGQAYNATLCDQTLASWFDSNFHAADPVSVDYPQWANDSCNPIYPNGTSLTGDTEAGSKGCTLGNYPDYVVNATNAEVISATLKWAADENIRIVIKNTGHSFPGRSVGHGSLSIWTHNMKSFQFHSDWTPSDCTAYDSTKKQMAATFGAGMQDREVYALTHQYGAVVVGGSNPSVGIMGWFAGGGHGPLSSSYGMGADNLLEAKVVTPQGNIVVANECQHSDLFWALRGGGASTFGVVVKARMKAFPSPQTSLVSLTLLQNPIEVANLSSRWWKMTADIHAQLPQIKDSGGQGYYTFFSPPYTQIYGATFNLYHYDSTGDTINEIWQPVKDVLDKQQDMLNYTYEVNSAPTFFDMWNATIGQGFEPVATGGGWMVSRLVTKRGFIEDRDAVAVAFEACAPIIAGHLIANENNRGLDIALNPAWRDAVAHIIAVTAYSDNDTPEMAQQVLGDTESTKGYALKQLSPESGAYFNEANPYEPDWQYTFFATNYPRLKAIKEKYDPDGVLWCLSCVGSENWIETGDKRLCRPSWY